MVALQSASRHVVAQQLNGIDDGMPIEVAYMCYRWEEDPPEEDREEGDVVLPVAYLYELQLEPSAQGKGLGSFMMSLLEQMVCYWYMSIRGLCFIVSASFIFSPGQQTCSSR
jgi:GNAT superfamily N-acetyltransferase